MSDRLGPAIEGRSVVVCVGSGGVGKTTVAASIALRAAQEGKRALVVTIDPARRLASSMGVSALGNVGTRISAERLAVSGVEASGELEALMLDVKRTCDELILRHAPSRDQADDILHNRFYQTASTVLAGSQEYMGMEKLYELHSSGAYDLIVLDTPPTTNALEFLEAPNRLLDAFGNDALKWIATPAVAAGRIGMQAMGLGSGYLVRQLSKLTGVETLQALAEFLLSMRGMYDGFKDRAAEVKALLSSEQAAFVLVTSPKLMVLDEARYFYGVLHQNDIHVPAIVVNRVEPDWTGAAGLDTSAEGFSDASLTTLFGAQCVAPIRKTLEEQQLRARADAEQARGLFADLEQDVARVLVPTLLDDIHDLAGLASLATYLFDLERPLPAQALPVLEERS
ncbi:MAG: ArsA family ATPase [Deltaproteobacteria bacterium]|nr:ArsA family ATPase [Deltaproteobacteria bacterium]